MVINLIKSICIGASVLIPGMSGGTMAMILGVYDRILSAISDFRQDIKGNTVFLLVFIAGMGVGLGVFARFVYVLFQRYQLPMIYLFMGGILGCIPMLFRKGGVKDICIMDMIWLLLGFLCVTSISGLPAGNLLSQAVYNPLSFLILMAIGAVISMAFILPGLDITYILLLLGVYDLTMRAVSDFNLLFWIPVTLGAAFGSIIVAKTIERAIAKYHEATYMLLAGFVLGSIFAIIPRLPTGIDIVHCVATFIAGFVAVKLILRYTEQ